MMANPWTGEVALVIDGERQVLKLTLGALAELEAELQEQSLRGVRKAQIKLATYYLVADAQKYARRIYEDMRSEKQERLNSIRSELLAIVDPECRHAIFPSSWCDSQLA